MISARFPSFLLFLLINYSWKKTRSSYDIILWAKNSKNFVYLLVSNSSKPCTDRKEEGYCEMVIQPVLFDCQMAWWNGDSKSNFPTLMTHSNDVKKKKKNGCPQLDTLQSQDWRIIITMAHGINASTITTYFLKGIWKEQCLND